MKSFICILLIISLARSVELLDKRVLQFMELKAKAGQAIDAVMDVLNGLKQSALDERDQLDSWHDETEDAFAARLMTLRSIRDTNKAIYEAAVKNRVFVEDEIRDTTNYLNWILNRYAEIDAMVEALHDERCEASLIFVTRCREHMEALTALDLLRGDLRSWEAAGMPVSLVEIRKMKSFNKLSAYTNLYKSEALSSFLSLTDDDDYLDVERRDAGDDHVDNDRAELDLEDFSSDRDDTEQTLIGKLMTRLDAFEQHLHDSRDDLIAAEVRAGRDTVRFIQESEKEVHTLQVEEDNKRAYLAKLENDLVLAQEHEATALATWNDSIAAVESCEAELEAHRAFYMDEVERLANDVEVVEFIIEIFHQELAGIDDIIRNQQFDTLGDVNDDRFNQGLFGTADVQDGPYTGQGGWQAAQPVF